MFGIRWATALKRPRAEFSGPNGSPRQKREGIREGMSQILRHGRAIPIIGMLESTPSAPKATFRYGTWKVFFYLRPI